MAVQVQFNLKQDILEAIYSGTVESKKEKDAELVRLVQEAHRCKTQKLLLCTTQLSCNFSTMDIYDGMIHIADGLMPQVRALAVVTLIQHQDDAQFAADVATNCGLVAGNFDDRASAEAWLIQT